MLRTPLRFFLLACPFLIIEQSNASSAAGQETLVGVVGPDFIVLGADSSLSQSIALTASNLDKISVLVDPISININRNNPCSQQTIVAAAAGDAADTDRLLQILAAHAAIQEYQASVGCDVTFVPSSSPCSYNTNNMPPPQPGLSVDAVAQLARYQIAKQLRSNTPLRVCLLLAGMVRTEDDPNNSQHSQQQQEQDSSGSTSFPAKQLQLQVGVSNKALLGTETVYPNNNNNNNKPQTTHHLPNTSSTIGLLKPRLYWVDEYGSLQSLHYGAHGFGANFIWSILDQGYRPDLTREQAVSLLQDCFAQLRQRYVINSPQPPCIKCIDANGCVLIR
jgi:20S proteasome alpha/beta subunit